MVFECLFFSFRFFHHYFGSMRSVFDSGGGMNIRFDGAILQSLMCGGQMEMPAFRGGFE